jgi:hypothetical protein
MTTPGFRPTHVVPQDGMPAWEVPDPDRPTVPLDGLLPVRLVDRRGDWGHIVCANGWSAWVDGRLLVAVPREPPAAGRPLARTADPRPLLARVEEALGRYRQAIEELTDGRLDGETFRGRTQGLRVGAVVDGEAVWLFEAEHERWVYCDGTRLSTYATSEPPAAPGREPAQVVGDAGGPYASEPSAAAGRESTKVVGGSGGASGAEPSAAAGREPTQVVRESDGAAAPGGRSRPRPHPPRDGDGDP